MADANRIRGLLREIRKGLVSLGRRTPMTQLFNEFIAERRAFLSTITAVGNMEQPHRYV